MSEVAATPAVENAEIAPVEVNRITQRRASAIARDEDRKVVDTNLSFLSVALSWYRICCPDIRFTRRAIYYGQSWTTCFLTPGSCNILRCFAILLTQSPLLNFRRIKRVKEQLMVKVRLTFWCLGLVHTCWNRKLSILSSSWLTSNTF